jgi:hypothetical protein
MKKEEKSFVNESMLNHSNLYLVQNGQGSCASQYYGFQWDMSSGTN